jgi:formylmethanofuran dehydrogenase subunit E
MNGEKHGLFQQARELFPYPACNQWGGVPPEYIRDCDEVDRKRQEWIKVQTIGEKCHECKHRPATKDYNGHGYMVCEPCYESLSDYFDEEYD